MLYACVTVKLPIIAPGVYSYTGQKTPGVYWGPGVYSYLVQMAKFWYLSLREINVYTNSPKNFKSCRWATAFILVPPVADLREVATGAAVLPLQLTTLK